MPEADLMTTAAAAERLGVSVKTVQRMAEDGRLRYELKLPGLRGTYLFKPASVERLAAKRAKVAAA